MANRRAAVTGGPRWTRARRHYPAPAASAKRANAGRDFEPVFFMIAGAMVLDSALADAEIRGDVLIGMAGEDQFHDLALSRE